MKEIRKNKKIKIRNIEEIEKKIEELKIYIEKWRDYKEKRGYEELNKFIDGLIKDAQNKIDAINWVLNRNEKI